MLVVCGVETVLRQERALPVSEDPTKQVWYLVL